jgi:hypothetical protein
LGTPLVMVIEPLFAIAAYTFLAAWDGRTDLGVARAVPARPAEQPDARPDDERRVDHAADKHDAQHAEHTAREHDESPAGERSGQHADHADGEAPATDGEAPASDRLGPDAP